MNPRLAAIAHLPYALLRATVRRLAAVARRVGRVAAGRTALMMGTALIGVVGYLVVVHAPIQSVAPSELVLRENRLTGHGSLHREGTLLVWPGLHEVRRYSLRDQIYRPLDSAKADVGGALSVDRGSVAGGGPHGALLARPDAPAGPGPPIA